MKEVDKEKMVPNRITDHPAINAIRSIKNHQTGKIVQFGAKKK